MNRVLVFACLTLWIGCRHKTGEEGGKDKKLESKDFLAMFQPLKMPVVFGDSSLSKKFQDSSFGWSAYRQFLPDSLIHKYFGKTVRPHLYTCGRIEVKNAETYLFIKALGTGRKIIYILCLDKEGKFQTGMPLIVRDEDSEIRYSASVDSKYTISVSRLHKDMEGRTNYTRTVYVYNSEGVFTLIMTESNENKPPIVQIYNPLDTLSHKHKFTGEYIQDKRNFISFRDGKNNSVLRFFVHFEKDNGNCKGELKGEAHFVSSTVARYIAGGDPCSVEFNFTEKAVRMKEVEGCGNHRGIRCYFEGLYNKHKDTKAKPAKARRG